jgi:hypothetical protein
MPKQILFFRKSRADLSFEEVTVTASEGQEMAKSAFARGNLTAWLTSDSLDANQTTFTIDFSEERTVSDILLLKHNFKSFTVQWWNGLSYQDFSPPISESTNLKGSSYYSVSAVSTQLIRLTVYSTQVPDQDKFLYQFIATEKLGRLNAWPVIKAPLLSRNRLKSKSLSGKMNIIENIGSFSCSLEIPALSNSQDLDLIERLYGANESFLVWLCGGDENQFKTIRQAYRMEDIYLMKCSDEYSPEYLRGVYTSSIKIDMNLQEVID